MKTLFALLFCLVTSFNVVAEQLPAVDVTDIRVPYQAFPSNVGPVYRAEADRSYTLMIFTQVYCSYCKPVIADMPRVYNEIGNKTTIRVVVLGRYNQGVQDYANQAALNSTFVANAQNLSQLGIKYTPTLILSTPSGVVITRITERGVSVKDLDDIIAWVKKN